MKMLIITGHRLKKLEQLLDEQKRLYPDENKMPAVEWLDKTAEAEKAIAHHIENCYDRGGLRDVNERDWEATGPRKAP